MEVFTNQFGGPLYTAAGESYRYLQVMSNEISNPKVVYCPADKSHAPATNFTTDFNSTRISYFVGLDASEARPNSLLAGDSNLANDTPLDGCILNVTANPSLAWTKERHKLCGNIALADGSVQQFSNEALKTYLIAHSSPLNRLLMP